MPIEHAPWLPKSTEGIQGQKIAVVGYSHYYVGGPDTISLTKDVVQSVVNGGKRIAFYQAIQGYFGFADDPGFWNRVIFFNFVPDSVGPEAMKYAPGTPEQLQRGRDRFLRIIHAEKPSKVFIFTRKGWCQLSETLEELSGGECTPLIQGRNAPSWGTYKAGDRPVRVCGFRHPQGASGEEMRAGIKAFLELQP